MARTNAPRNRFVIGVHERAVLRANQIPFQEIISRAGLGRVRLGGGTLLRHTILIKAIELARAFGFNRAALGLRGELRLRSCDLSRRNRIRSILERRDEFRARAGFS